MLPHYPIYIQGKAQPSPTSGVPPDNQQIQGGDNNTMTQQDKGNSYIKTTMLDTLCYFQLQAR